MSRKYKRFKKWYGVMNLRIHAILRTHFPKLRKVFCTKHSGTSSVSDVKTDTTGVQPGVREGGGI